MSRARPILAALAAALGLAGCSLSAIGPSPIGTQNTCSAPSECGDGATCSQGLCVATTYDLTGMLIEVRPYANATFGANTSFILDPKSAGLTLASQGGEPFFATFDATLPEPVSIRGGKVLLDPSTPIDGACPADRALPARLTFFPVPAFTGFNVDPTIVSTVAASGSNTFDADLGPDRYDVYIEPQAIDGCNGGVAYPPFFLADQQITAGGAVSWTLPPLGKLSGTITGFQDVVDGQFTLQLVEPTRGLVISSGEALTPMSGGFAVSAQIGWEDKKAPPILRLTPSDPSTQPTLYWSLAGADYPNPVADLSVTDLLIDPVEVSGTILGADGFTGVESTLSFQSETLFGEIAQNAAFTLEGQHTDSLGNFTVKLPPGNYLIRATPVADSALAVTDWELMWPSVDPNMPPPTCVCAKTFTLQSKLAVGGSVIAASGVQITNAPVAVTPSQSSARSYWADKHTLAPAASRVANTITDDFGRFSLLVDPGTNDLSVQPDASTNFPWLVKPRFSPPADGKSTSFVVPAPAFLSGTVRAPDGTVIGHADVSAWLPVPDPTAKDGLTGTVVKIATASTDVNGVYTLVLPSSLGQ